jgi:hypothetical protein
VYKTRVATNMLNPPNDNEAASKRRGDNRVESENADSFRQEEVWRQGRVSTLLALLRSGAVTSTQKGTIESELAALGASPGAVTEVEDDAPEATERSRFLEYLKQHITDAVECALSALKSTDAKAAFKFMHDILSHDQHVLEFGTNGTFDQNHLTYSTEKSQNLRDAFANIEYVRSADVQVQVQSHMKDISAQDLDNENLNNLVGSLHTMDQYKAAEILLNKDSKDSFEQKVSQVEANHRIFADAQSLVEQIKNINKDNVPQGVKESLEKPLNDKLQNDLNSIHGMLVGDSGSALFKSSDVQGLEMGGVAAIGALIASSLLPPHKPVSNTNKPPSAKISPAKSH